MGTRIFVDGTYQGTDIHLARYVPAVSKGLVYAGIFDTNINKASRNYAMPTEFATVFGTPVVSSNSTKFQSGLNYLNAEIKDTYTELTVVFVSKFSNLAGSIISNYATPGTPSFGIFESAGKWRTSLFFGGVAVVGGVVVAASEVGIYDLCSLKITSSGLVVFKNHTKNISTTYQDPSSGPRTTSTTPMRIGSAIDPSLTGSTDLSRLYVYDRVLSDTEIEVSVNQIRKEMGLKGVTV